MKFANLFFAVFFVVIPMVCAAAPKCSQTNITRCLDSACAINSGMNPAARCQYCGNSAAGTPPTQKGLSNITVGQSAKYTLSAKELAVAPSDPGKRYIWATTECIKKVGNCTPDDVSSIYDKLIEQSCKAAGANIQMTRAVAGLNQKPTAAACKKTLESCIENKCGANFEMCGDDNDLDRVVSECATATPGCDEHIKGIKQEFASSRKKQMENRENIVQDLVAQHQADRESKWAGYIADCASGGAESKCVSAYTGTFGKKIAQLICGHYKAACDTTALNNNSTIKKTATQTTNR